MKNRNLTVDDNWLTPDWLYKDLNDRWHFDFDPCPYNTGEKVNDGLVIPCGKTNFINPPYSRKLKDAFVKRAIDEVKMHPGTVCVLLLPVSTSTILFHDFIKPNAYEINFLRGRVKFQKLNENGHRFTPKNRGMHDSMIVVFA